MMSLKVKTYTYAGNLRSPLKRLLEFLVDFRRELEQFE